jgi:LPXTG-site transpeptidase (sortase) family protein
MSLTGATIPSGSLASPGTCTVTATVRATPSEPPTSHTNTIPAGEITTDEGGTNASPISDTINVTGIEIAKAFSPTTFAAGQTSTLTITITNPATIDFTGATLSDTLPTSPDSSLYFTGTPTTTCASGSETVALSGTPARTVTLTDGTIPASGSCTITATVTTDPDASEVSGYNNVIPANSLVTSEGASNSEPANAIVNVTTVSLDKGYDVNTISYPEVATLTITIINPETGGALTGIDVSDTLPTGLVIANPANASTTCNDSSTPTLTATPGGTSISLTNGSMAAAVGANQTCEIEVDVTAEQGTSSGTYTNSIGSGDLTTNEGPTNSFGISTDLEVEAVSVEKSFQYDGFQAGTNNELTITLTNPTSEDYINVALDDVLPQSPNTALYYTGTPTTTCSSGSIVIATTNYANDTVRLTGATIPAGSPGTCTITATVSTDVSATDASYTNTIPVGGLTTEITPGVPGPSNTEQATAPVEVYTDGEGVTASKSFSPANVDIFENSRLRLTFEAPPDTDLTNFSFTDNLPSGVTVSNSTAPSLTNCGGSATLTDGSGGSLDIGDTSIRLNNGTILLGQTCTVDIYVTSNAGTSAGATYTNTITPADVSNNENRTTPGDVSDDLTVTTPSTLTLEKAFYPTIVGPDGRSTLTITLENEGTTPLENVELEDILPGDTNDGLVIADPANITTTCNVSSTPTLTAVPGTQTIQMTGGSIPARVGGVNGLCTIVVNVEGRSTDGTTAATHTNTIPVTQVEATLSGTPSTMNPQDPASANLTVRDLDLEVVKGFDPQLVYGGADSQMSIILRNPNPSAELLDITFRDNMWLTDQDTSAYPGYPGSVTRPDYPATAYPEGEMILIDPPQFDASDCGPSATLTQISTSVFEFSGGYLAPGDECTLTLRATMTVNGNRTNTIPAAAVTSSNGAYNHTPTSATLTNLAGASVSKSFAPNPIAAGLGSYSILTIEIRTTATVNITGLGLVDDLPAGLQVADWLAGGVAASDPPTNGCGGTLSADPGVTTIQLSNGVLATGFENCFLTIPVSGAEPGDYSNVIPQGGLDNDQDVRNIQATEDTLTLTPYSLGNRVWYDTDNDGVVDAGEIGVENVRVELYRDDGSTPGVYDASDTYLDFETTDADGYYRFDDLGGGDYVVVIPEENFDRGNPLSGYVSSGTSIAADGSITDSIETDPDDDADNEDNGATALTAGGELDYVSAQTVTLGPDYVEPLNEADPATNPEAGEATDNQSNRTVDFGFYRQELGDQVFLDAVIDGVYDTGDDSPIAGATVQLFSSGDTEINVGPDGIWGTDDDAAGGMLTDAGGNYLFSGLPEGDYIVKVYLPGYRSTIDTSPSNTPADVANPDTNIDDNDNGVGQGEGLIASFPVTLTPGDVGADSNNLITNSTGTTYNPTLDFGYVFPRSIGNRLWFDDGGITGTANNGVIDGDEGPVAGARVSLYADDNSDGAPDGGVLAWDTTDADGYYLFDGLFPGNYLVGIDYTNFQVGGVLEEYTSSAGDSNNDTDSNDNGIDRIQPGDATASPYGILSDTIDLTAVTDSAPTGETDLSSDNVSGDLTNNPTNWDGTNSRGRYGETDSNSDLTIDFGFFKPMSIGNRVFYDNGAGANFNNGLMDGGENPVAGVRVELYQDTDGTSGLQVATDTLLYYDTTDADGYYLFDNLPEGEYYVHIPVSNFTGSGVLRGWYNSDDTFSNDVDSNDNGVNLKHPDVNGVSSGLLVLSEDSEPTGETQLSGDTTPAGNGYDPTAWDGPESRGRWNESDDNSNLTIDFGFIPPLSLGNRVWIDNGAESAATAGFVLSQFNNGIMDGDEVGVENVVLNLYYDANGNGAYTDIVDGVDEANVFRTTTTDANGYYIFDGLPEGIFYVEVESTNFGAGNALEGYQSSEDQPAFDDEISDVNDNGEDDANHLANGISSRDFTLEYQTEPTGEDASGNTTEHGPDGWGRFGETDNSSNLTLDFGFMAPHSIGNRVWRDSDNSGTINAPDDADPGIENVVVNLYAGVDGDSNGIPDDLTVLATTTTDDSGYYLFGNLPAGNYIVGIPAGNFAAGQPLDNLRSSTGTPEDTKYTSDPVDGNVDSEDHGRDPVPPDSGAAVYSPIILLADNEQTGETDLPSDTVTYGPDLRGVNGEPDAGSDLTVDFGFFGGTDVPFSIGNHLWYDDGKDSGGAVVGTINDGVRQAGEVPVAGARVELYRDGDGDGPEDIELVRFDVTDSDGFYLFDNLDPGEYYVRVAAGNFTDSFDPDGAGSTYSAAPGVLRGWYSSQITALSESGVDNDDNGVDTSFPETLGVYSSVIILERGINEPTGETYLSNDSGTALGFDPTTGDGTGHIGRFGETDATSNMTVDFGFIPPVSIGNRVWIDDGSTATGVDIAQYNNGIMDGTEQGVSGVTVALYKDGLVTHTTTTDSEGYYLFDRLEPDANYEVQIVASNFQAGGELQYYVSSFDAVAPTDDDVDIHDKGSDDTAPATNGILSPEFEMAYDDEPTTETDLSTDTVTYGVDNVGPYPGHTDINSNLTLDFGFVRPRSLGNRLWFDTNNNRQINAGEQPVPDGVRVSLYLDADADGVPDGAALRWDTTENGYYLFDNLAPTNYVVGVDASNFQPGGSLVGYFSSTGNVNNATNNTDRRDNGIDSTNPAGSTYGILSTTIDLSVDSGYPTGETEFSSDNVSGDLTDNPTNWDGPSSIGRYGESNQNSDLTIDFGFYKVEIGNLVYLDENANGTYDAGTDAPLDNVLVQLFDGGGEIITGADGILNTTDDSWGPDGVFGNGDDGTGGILTGSGSFGTGEYLFSGLPEDTYVVRVTTPTTPNRLVSTIDTANAADTADPDGEVDNNDNGIGIGDATRVTVSSGVLFMDAGEGGGTVTVTAATGTTRDTGLDFGFTYAYALGNRVWFDTDNDSSIDAGTEVGVDGVRFDLYAADGSGNPTGSILATTITANGGYYLFDYLTADEYVVVLPASNFADGAVLDGYWSSATSMDSNGSLSETAAPDPDDPGADTVSGTADDDVDSDDNGTRQTSGTFNGAVISQAVTLGATVASEPTGEADLDGGSVIGDQPDSRSNMKLDFGFYKTEIGNLVYVDSIKNGVYDPAETLIAGMTVQLFNSDGTVEVQVGPDGILGTSDDATGGVQTNASGEYLFSGLPEGDYIVRAAGLTGYTSTIDSYDRDDNYDPDENVDDNDNGDGISTGAVDSGQLTIVAGNAGANSNNIVDDGSGAQGVDYGTTYDPTVDFGFIDAVAIGNLVWFDTGAGGGVANNGIQDGAEAGAENVRVELYSAGADGAVGGGDDAFIAFDTTDANGNYVFDNLIPDGYYLFIPANQFDDAGDALYGYMSTTGNGTDETQDQDTDENGIDENDLAANGIYSPVYDLQPDSEPDATDVETDYTGSLDDDNVNFTADFGFLEYVAMGNRVWLDTGAGADYNDGEFDAGEVGVNDVTVNLYDSSDTLINTTVTADYGGQPGYYEFDMLAPGQYYVSIPAAEFQAGGDLEGYVSTTTTGSNETSDEDVDENGIDADAAANGIRTQTYDLQPNSETTADDDTSYSGVLGDSNVNFTADLSFVRLVAIGNRVWFDTGAGAGGVADNGIQDGDEAGVENVRVELYSAGADGVFGGGDDVFVAFDTTDVNGDYYFDLLNPGNYYISIPASQFDNASDPLYGYVSSTGNGAVNDDDDQDADENGIDENDLPANGIHTPVYALTPDSEPAADIDTGYAGYLDDDNVNLTADFGFLQKVAIGNRVWLDNGAGAGTANNGILDGSEAGIDDVTVQLYDAGPDGVAGGGDDTLLGSVTTSGGGYYAFDNLLPGSYYLNIPATEFQSGGDLENLLSSSGNGTDETTDETGDENGVDNAAPEAVVGGGITSTVFNLQPNSEQAGEDQSNYTGALDDDNVNFTADFGFTELVAIGNRVWLDTGAGANFNNGILDGDEAGINGVTVNLYDSSDTLIDTTSTADFGGQPGYYEFDKLLPGQYYVSIPAAEFNGTEELLGYVSTTATGANETSDEDADENGIDDDVATYGIRTQLYDLQPNTEQTGEAQTNYSGTLDDDNVNFTADLSFVSLVALGNRVWFDTGAGGGTANDGIQNGTETGVENVTVDLYRAGDTIGTPYRTTSTDANGDYYFDLLNPGNYFVHIPAAEFQAGGDLEGYISTEGNGGIGDNDDHDADENGIDESDLPANGIRTPTYTLTPDLEPAADIDTGYSGYLDDDNVNLTADFGFLQKVAIGNRVWLDTGAGANYNNGVLDGDETGINGITVNLYDSTDTLIDTTVTADFGGQLGYYEFDMLLPGQYYVSIPAVEFQAGGDLEGYVSTTTTGSNETGDEDADENGIDTDVATNGIRTQAYDLQPNGETTSDDETSYSGYLEDDNVNFTADLSFVRLVALGNRVWFDTGAGGGIANNGVQDGSEVGVSGVTVQLFNVGDDPSTDSPVASTATNGNGDYQFDLLNPGDYFVHIPTSQFQSGAALYDYVSSTGNGTDETFDQDADENGVDPTAPSSLVTDGISSTAYTLAIDSETTADDETGYTGYLDDDNVNFTADFGFLQKVAVGNRVWLDTGAGGGVADNGILDGSEAGIDDVTVELYSVGPDGTAGTGDDVSRGSVVTSGGGYYFFDNLLPGSYYLVIPPSEFNGSETLAGYLSSTGNGSDETTDETGDENGIDNTEPWTNGITSTTYDLQPDSEQSGEAQTNYTGELDDDNVNFTADFAFQNSPQVNLAITKDDGYAYYLAGGSRTYTVTVTNNGPIDVSGLTVSDARPSQITSWTWACTSSSPDSNPATYACTADATNPATFTDSLDLPVGASVTYTVTATIDAAATGDLVNTATVTPPAGTGDLDSNDNSDTDTDTPAAITVAKDDGISVVSPGSTLTYTILVENTGAVDLTDITITDTLPDDFTYQNASVSPDTVVGQVLTWNGISLNSGNTLSIDVEVRVSDTPVDVSFTNEVEVSDSITGAAATDDDTDTLAVTNAKTIIGTNIDNDTSLQVLIGEVITYQITLTVPPTPGTMGNLQALDVLEEGLAFDECLGVIVSDPGVTTDLPGGFSDACPAAAGDPDVTNDGHNVLFDFGNVVNVSGADQIITVQYTVDVLDIAANVAGVTGINNTVTWTWDGGSLVAAAPPVEILEPNLSIEKNASPTRALIGSTIEFTIDIAHTSASTSHSYDVVVTDQLPSGLDYIGNVTTSGLAYDRFNYDIATSTVSFEWDVFPLLATATITFEATFVGPPPVVNEASVAWTSIPLDPGVQSNYNVNSTERFYDPLDPAGVNNYIRSSSVTISKPALPRTGFAPGRVTELPAQPRGSEYEQLQSLTLGIPRLGVSVPIVGIPSASQGWDLTWLSNQAGWLEGTAYPTLAGNTGITAHTYLADGTPGPFVDLGSLYFGDRVYIHANGSIYIYEVREVNVVSPEYLSVLDHEEYDWITLITCREYNEETDDYNYRVVVRAVLIKVELDQ